jgi:tetratricopeptide (TPR) repeat protein
MMATMRNLRALLVLTFAACVVTACSVMPFQGNADRSTGNWASDDYVSEDTEVDTDPEGYEREGEGAPGNLVDNPGGERTGTAGLTGKTDSVEDAARGQNVRSGDSGSREAFDADRRRDVEYRWLKDRGVLAMKNGDLDDAERYFERAIALKPTENTSDVVKLLDEVRNLASKGTSLAPRWADMPAAAQEEYEIEARRTYDAALAAEADRRWAEASELWEKLRRLVKFAPYGAQLQQNYDMIAQAGLDRARTELQRERKALQEEALKRERRLRDVEAQENEERRKEEIVELWRQAVYNLELRRFKTADEIVDRIIYLDPQFREAESLKRDISDARLIQMNRDTFERRIAGYQETLRQLREAMNPQTTILEYPTGLLAERIRARRAHTQDSVRIDPDIQRIENALESRIIDVNYEEETLSNVVADMQRRAGISMRLHPDVDGDESVNIALEGIPIGSALNIILTDLSLKTQIKFGVLFIVGEDEEQDASSVVTRVHDVRDLTFNITEFVGPVLRLIPAEDTQGGPSFSYPDESERTLDIDRIEELIEESVAPDTWEEPNALRFFGGQLVATHTPQVQAELRDFLDELRKIAGLMVNIEVRFISVEDDYLQDFGIDFRGNGGPAQVPNQANTTLEDVTTGPEDNAGGQFDNGSGGIAPANPTSGIFFNNQDPNNPPVNFNQDIRGRFEHIYDNALGNVLSSTGGFSMQFAYFVDLTQINAVITAVQKRRKARVLIAPRLSAFNTQRANITIVNQIPYIQDFELQTATTAAIANPVIDTILDGMVLDVKPTVSNDRRFITIEVQPTVAELALPIPTFTTTLGPTSAVTIQIPEIKLQTVQTTVRVPDGGAVVIAGLKTVRDKWIESGVPILSDIPLLGILFKRQGRSKEQYNLVIVVHAKVIDLNDEEMRRPGWDS